MAAIIQIKRSSKQAQPTTLALGELAYSYADSAGSPGSAKLFIGIGPALDSTAVPQMATRVAAIGGEYFTNLSDAGTPGIAVGDKFLLLDSAREVDYLSIRTLVSNSANISQLDVDSSHISRLSADSAFIWKLDVDSGYISRLTADSAHILKLDVDSGYISRLTADSAHILKLDVDSGHIIRLTADSGHISQLDVDSGHIIRLTADSGHISQLDVDSSHTINAYSDFSRIKKAEVDSAHIRALDVDSGHIIRLTADSSYIVDLDVDSAHLKYAHIDGALIDSGHSTYHSFGIAHSPEYRGPGIINIDPFPFGDVAGKVNIVGDLNVQGITTSVQSQTVTIKDTNILLAESASDSAFASGAGITIGGPVGANITWQAGAAGTEYENYWTTNRLFYNKDLQADSSYFKYFKADSGFVDYLKVNKLEFPALNRGGVAYLGTDQQLHTDSNFTYDSDDGLSFGKTMGMNFGLTIKPNGEIVSYEPAVFKNLRVIDLVPGSILISGNGDSVQGAGDLLFGQRTDTYSGTNDGLLVGRQIIQDSGWYRIILDRNTGIIDASGIQIGSHRGRPVLRNAGDRDTWYFIDSAQARPFYGLSISDQGDSLSSTLPINYFRSDMSKDSGASLRRFPGGPSAADDSDISILIRGLTLQDSSVFEVHKDGTINFTGALMQNGVPFTGGGLFTSTTADDAFFAPRDFSSTLPFGNYGRVGVGTDNPKQAFEVQGGIFQVKGPRAGGAHGAADTNYEASKSGEYSLFKNLHSVAGSNATTTNVADSAEGSRFAFIPGKAATRGGYFTNHEVNWDDIGFHSVAFGLNAKAKGAGAIAMGDSAVADGIGSIALGSKNQLSSAKYAFVAGRNNSDGSYTADYSVGLGQNNTFGGLNNVLLGKDNIAGVNTVANENVLIGKDNQTSGLGNHIIGQENVAHGAGFILGFKDSTSANLAVAVGSFNAVSGPAAMAIGQNQVVSGNNAIGIGPRGTTTGNRSINISLRTTSVVAGAGQDPNNNDRLIPGIVQDEELLAIQGGNVSIGRESDMFDVGTSGVGNLFVGGNILYGGEVQKLNPAGGTPIAANVFTDNGTEITMSTPRNIAIGKTDAQAEVTIRGGLQIDGTIVDIYGPGLNDSAIFDSATGPAGLLYNNMFMYNSKAGILRAGKILLNEHINSDLGLYSIGMGEEPYAKGKNSISLGEKNRIGRLKRGTGRAAGFLGNNSIAIGKNNEIIRDNNIALGEGNKVDSSSTTEHSILIGKDNIIGRPYETVFRAGFPEAQAGDQNYIFGASNTVLTGGGDKNVIVGVSNMLAGNATAADNFIIGKDNTFPNAEVSEQNIVIGHGWTDSHHTGSNQQYGVQGKGMGKNTVFIGGNTLIPEGLERGIVMMNPVNFNDSGVNLYDSAKINKGLNNTNIMIGKTAQTPHNITSKYKAGFNRSYALDVHGDINIDSGATLYIGGLNIKDFVSGTLPSVEVTAPLASTPVATIDGFTVSQSASATVTTLASAPHNLGSAGGAGTGLAVKFFNLLIAGGSISSSLNYDAGQDNVFFVQEVNSSSFNLFTDRACTVAADTSGFATNVPSASPKGTYNVVNVVAPVTSFTIDKTGTNLLVQSTAHGLTAVDGVIFNGVTASAVLNGIPFFCGPDDGSGAITNLNEFEIYRDKGLTVPVLSSEFTGTITTTGAIYSKTVPVISEASSPNLDVVGALSVGDSARFQGSIYIDQTAGDSFIIGGLSFDSHVTRSSGGLITNLTNILDSAYVQARVSVDNFWSFTAGALRAHQLPTANLGLGTNPVIINKSLTEADATSNAYKETIGGVDHHKFKLDVTGKTRIDLPSSFNTLISDPISIAAANPLAPDGLKTPIVTTAADGQTVAWPTKEYISKIVTNDYVKDRMNIDSAVIASVVDSSFMKGVISPNYILSHANDSSHFRRSADGHTLYFGGPGFNHGTNVAIGAESAPSNFPNSKLYVQGDITVDSGYFTGGHSVISGFDITADSNWEFDFTDLATDSYFTTHANSTIVNSVTLQSLLLANTDSFMPITIGSSPGLDSEFAEVFLVTPKDVTDLSLGYDSTKLTKGTLIAGTSNILESSGQWAWANGNTISVREAAIPGYDSIGDSAVVTLVKTHSIDIINKGLHSVTSLKGNILQALRLKDSATRYGGSALTSGLRQILNYNNNGLTKVYVNGVALDSNGERWEETSGTQVNIFDSEANTSFKLNDTIKVESRSKKNTASLTIKGPLTVEGQYDITSPPISLTGNLTQTGPSVFTGTTTFNAGNVTIDKILTLNDSAIFKNGFTVENTTNKYAKFGSHINMAWARRADSNWRVLNGGSLWDSTDGNYGNLTVGESAELYYGPYYPASYDSARGFNLVDPYVGRSFDSNIMRIVDSTYIGTRLITPWNRIGIAPNRKIYYDEEGAVIIGHQNTVNPSYDTTTRFAMDSGNMLLLSSNVTDITNHPKKGVVPVNNVGNQIGAGARLMWIPEYGAFRAGYVNGTTAKWDSDEVGLFSQGIGHNTLATDYSTAIGYDAIAGKVAYTATGTKDIVAGGHSTKAIAIGYNVNNPTTEGVGIGIDITNTNKKEKSVSIGHTITNTGQAGTSATPGVGIGYDVSVGTGTAIGREVIVGNNSEDLSSLALGYKATTGRRSVAIGSNITSGQTGVTIGKDLTTSGKSSVNIGLNSAAGDRGVSVGKDVTSGRDAVAFGLGAVASGSSSFAIGANERASGTNSAAVGIGNVASGRGSFALGKSNTLSGNDNFAVGISNTVLTSGFAIGTSNSSISRGQAIGSNNKNADETNIIGFSNDGATKGSAIIGVSNRTITFNSKVIGFSNSNLRTAEVHGSQNTDWRNVTIFGSQNTGPGLGTTTDGAGGYIYGTKNSITQGGMIFGRNNTTLRGGDIYGQNNSVEDQGYAFGSDNVITFEGYAFGHANIINGTTNKAYGFGNANQATLGGIAIGNTTNASNFGIALGTSVEASAVGAIAIGSNITVSGTNSVGISLGTNAVTLADTNTFAIMNGKVGINTTSVGLAYTLEVDGNINTDNTGDYYRQGKRLYNYIRDDVADAAWIRFNANAAYVQSHIQEAHYRTSMPATKYFYADQNTNYLYTNAPRVGIKTSTPSYDLDVNGSLNVQSLYWQGDKILDSNQGNQVYLTHQVAQFYIQPDSATEFFDSDYIFARQQNYGFNLGETYSSVINDNYINTLIDRNLFLDSSEAEELIDAKLANYAFEKNFLGRAEEAASTFKMGVATSATSSHTLRVGGPTFVGGNLDIGTGGDNFNININGSPLQLTSVFEATLAGIIYQKVGQNIGIGVAGPQYQLDVDGDINISNGQSFRIDGADLLTGVLDSAFVNLRIKKDDIIAKGFDSDYLRRYIIDSDYIKSVADSDYIQTVIDSDYIQNIADSAYITSIADSAYITSIADSDYIKSVADSDYIKFVADSDYIKGIADSAYVTSIADSNYIKGIADSAYVTSIVDSAYIFAITDTKYDSDFVKAIADSAYVTSIADSGYVLGIADSAYVTGMIDSDYISAITGIGVRAIDFGPYGVTYRSTANTVGQLPDASTYPGLVATTTGDNKVRAALGGSWQALPLENTNVSFNTITPTAHETYDLGSSTLAWRDLYLKGNTIHLGGLKLKDSNGVFLTTDSLGVATAVNLSGASTKDLSEDSNLYYTDARVDSNITGKDLDMGTNKILYSNVYSALGDLPSASSYHGMFAHVHATGKAYFAHAGSWIDLASGADITTAINNLIDGAPAAMDTLNEFATALGNDANFATTITGLIGAKLDSADAITLIDSAYIQARVVPAGIDSSAVAGMIDSAYVQNRSVLIDSAYIQARQTLSTFDSGEVLQIVDSAYIQARQAPGTDSAAVQAIIDSAYIAARSGSGNADSATIIGLIDSAYIAARTTAGSGGDTFSAEYTTFRFTATAGQTVFTGSDISSQTLEVADKGVQVYLNGLHLLKGTDYTVTGTTTITLTIAANLNDDIVITNIAPGVGNSKTFVIGKSLFKDYKFVATGGQTAFSGADINAETLAFDDSNHQVYINGIRLNKAEDYTVNSGTNTMTLTLAASDSDDVIVQTIINASTGNSFTGMQSLVDSAVAALVDTAPATLNTLNELAAALGDDANYSTTITTALSTKLATADFTSTADTYLATKSITTLSDVHTTTPTEGQILIWDNGNSYWAPGVLPAGTDSAAVTGMIDSAYVALHAPANTYTNAINFTNYYYDADSGQSVFSGTDKNGASLTITSDNYQVFNNGIRLVSGVDYTVNASANTVTLNGFVADSGDDFIINTLQQTLTQSHIMVGDTYFKNYKFVADSGQLAFTGTDANGIAFSIDSDNFTIFQNGIKLLDSDDFTSTPISNTITLTNAASTDDEIVITTIENKAGAVTVNAEALIGLVDSAYIAARTTAPNTWAEVTTTPVTAVAGQRLIVDTSTAKTVNLPSAATLGDEIRIIDGTGQASTNAIVIARNGHKIEGADSDLSIDVNRAAFGLVYYNATNGWLFTEK